MYLGDNLDLSRKIALSGIWRIDRIACDIILIILVFNYAMRTYDQNEATFKAEPEV
jgi:hypothetical protein